mmetsp:Transcript_21342/g.40859  ORF Transcript_21342/g.40859 Transcript_21342/m.40859 type:complete len:183 (-) Transcript_21342:64-612(-)
MFQAPRMAGITVDIEGHRESKESPFDAHTIFTICVRNGWSTTRVKRRYSEFVTLDKQLRPIMTSLPELPPKSLMRKLLMPLVQDPYFLNDRVKRLRKLLEAMVLLDPVLHCPELREFLGVTCPPAKLADDLSLPTKSNAATFSSEVATSEANVTAQTQKLAPTLLEQMQTKGGESSKGDLII